MKGKIIAAMLISAFVFTLNGCTNSDNPNKQVTEVQDENDGQTNETQDPTDNPDTESIENGTMTDTNTDLDAEEEMSAESIIENAIRYRVIEQYYDTDIDSITINENLGTDIEGDYIVLVNLTWNVKNSATTSKEMIKLYSDDLAATMAESCPDVQELAIFWTVPYLNDASAKCSYERKDGGMYTMDDSWIGFN